MHSSSKNVSLLIIGTEITDGIVQDLHVKFLADKLFPIFKGIKEIRMIPDNRRIIENIKEEIAISDLVIITGGLGSTSDDLTRQAIAEAANIPLEFDSELWDEIKANYTSATIDMNISQAYFPKGFKVLPNKIGTASGFYGFVDKTLLISLPGPPREMNLMFNNYVEPFLREYYSVNQENIIRATAFLFSENQIEQILANHCSNSNVYWGTRVFDFGVYFYISGESKEKLVSIIENIILEQGSILIKLGELSLSELIKDSIFKKEASIYGAESCTGGMISSLLTSIPGISKFFEGAAIVYSVEQKAQVFGMEKSTIEQLELVSEGFVELALDKIKAKNNCELGFFVSGEAGPESSDARVKVGTVVIGAYYKDRKIVRTFFFPSKREIIRRKTTCACVILMDSLLNSNYSIDKGFDSFYII